MKDDEKGYQYARDNMLMRQRDTAEEDRDQRRLRAMQSEQQRQALRDLLVIAEGQRDQAKIDAEYWKGEWALVMGQLGGARAEVEALRQVDDAMVERAANAIASAHGGRPIQAYTGGTQAAMRKEARAALDAALAVQPSTGDTNE